jgi:hypothetical protein
VIAAVRSNRELLSATTGFEDGTIIVQDRTALSEGFYLTTTSGLPSRSPVAGM